MGRFGADGEEKTVKRFQELAEPGFAGKSVAKTTPKTPFIVPDPEASILPLAAHLESAAVQAFKEKGGPLRVWLSRKGDMRDDPEIVWEIVLPSPSDSQGGGESQDAEDPQ